MFFRATSLSSAVDYLSAMVGLGEAQPAALLLNGVVYQPSCIFRHDRDCGYRDVDLPANLGLDTHTHRTQSGGHGVAFRGGDGRADHPSL